MSRIKGIIDAVSDLAMDYQSRMARAKEQGFDTDTPYYHRRTEPGGSMYPTHVKGKLWSVEERGLPRDTYKGTNDDIVKALEGEGFHGVDSGHETVVFDPANIRSVNAAFDPAKKGSSNILAGAGGLGLMGMMASEDADAGPEGKGLLDSIGDTALETMSGVNRAMADGVNFLTSDQINAILNLSGSDKRIPDLYDIPGIEGGTQGNYMEPGLLRQIVRQGSEFLSPI